MRETVIVDVGRCVCVHGMAQVIDALVQAVLFHRQFVPDILPAILRSTEDAKQQRLADTYREIRHGLQEAFHSASRLNECAIVIGANPHLPVEIYRVRLSTCDEEQEEGQCEILSEKEMRCVCSVVNLNMPWQSLPRLSDRNKRLYLFVKAESLHMDRFEQNDTFELPSAERHDQLKRGAVPAMITVSVRHHCPLIDRPLTGREKGNEEEEGNGSWALWDTVLRGMT